MCVQHTLINAWNNFNQALYTHNLQYRIKPYENKMPLGMSGRGDVKIV